MGKLISFLGMILLLRLQNVPKNYIRARILFRDHAHFQNLEIQTKPC